MPWSEEIISRFEKILIRGKKVSNSKIFETMTQDDLNQRIEQSELDFKENRFKSNAELLDKFE